MIEIDTDYDAPPQMIPLDHPAAVEWLTRLAKNVAPDVEIGKPLAAIFDPAAYCMRFLTTVALFESYYVHAERLLELGEGEGVVYEWTSWAYGGLETDRIARRPRDLGAAAAVE